MPRMCWRASCFSASSGCGRGAEAVQVGVAFWHMVDLVWVLILPPVYLLA